MFKKGGLSFLPDRRGGGILPSSISAYLCRLQLQEKFIKVFIVIRVNVSKHRRNRGHSSKCDLANTLHMVGLSTTHMKMILFYSNIYSFARNKFGIVNGIFLQQNPRNCQHWKRSWASLAQSLNCFHINPIWLMLLTLCYYKNRSLPNLKNIIWLFGQAHLQPLGKVRVRSSDRPC